MSALSESSASVLRSGQNNRSDEEGRYEHIVREQRVRAEIRSDQIRLRSDQMRHDQILLSECSVRAVGAREASVRR